MGIRVMSLDPDTANAEAYMELAWYEHVEDAQKELPILQISEKEWVSGDRVAEKLGKIDIKGV